MDRNGPVGGELVVNLRSFGEDRERNELTAVTTVNADIRPAHLPPNDRHRVFELCDPDHMMQHRVSRSTANGRTLRGMRQGAEQDARILSSKTAHRVVVQSLHRLRFRRCPSGLGAAQPPLEVGSGELLSTGSLPAALRFGRSPLSPSPDLTLVLARFL